MTSHPLLADLRKQLAALESDLRSRTDEARIDGVMRSEWRSTREASRTGMTYALWRDEQMHQTALAWLLSSSLLRFCEDKRLISTAFLAGPGERLTLTEEQQAQFARQRAYATDRDWILSGFDEMCRSPHMAGRLDQRHNPLGRALISHHVARDLIAFWRTPREDGELVYDLTNAKWDTNFLSDLYQDLSERARKTYALLSCPPFVRLLTMIPATPTEQQARIRLRARVLIGNETLLGYVQLAAVPPVAGLTEVATTVLRRDRDVLDRRSDSSAANGVARMNSRTGCGCWHPWPIRASVPSSTVRRSR
jgi:hypothetical protein